MPVAHGLSRARKGAPAPSPEKRASVPGLLRVGEKEKKQGKKVNNQAAWRCVSPSTGEEENLLLTNILSFQGGREVGCGLYSRPRGPAASYRVRCWLGAHLWALPPVSEAAGQVGAPPGSQGVGRPSHPRDHVQACVALQTDREARDVGLPVSSPPVEVGDH